MPRVLPRSEAMLVFHKFAKGKAGSSKSARSEFTYGDFLSALRFISTTAEMVPILAKESGGEAIANIRLPCMSAVGPLLSWQMLCEYMRIKGSARPDMRWRVFPPKSQFLQMRRTTPACIKERSNEGVQIALEILEGVFVGLFEEHLLLPVPVQQSEHVEDAKEAQRKQKLSPVRPTRGSHNRRPNHKAMQKIKRSRAAFGGTITTNILKKQAERKLITDASPEKDRAALRPPSNPLRTLFAKSAKSLTKTHVQKSHIVAFEILDSILKRVFASPLIISKNYYPKTELTSRIQLAEQVARHAKKARAIIERKMKLEDRERAKAEKTAKHIQT